MSHPDPLRQEEIFTIINAGVRDENRDLDEYHDWDDIIECDEEMTLEEWEWARDHIGVDVSVRTYWIDEDRELL